MDKAMGAVVNEVTLRILDNVMTDINEKLALLNELQALCVLGTCIDIFLARKNSHLTPKEFIEKLAELSAEVNEEEGPYNERH